MININNPVFEKDELTVEQQAVIDILRRGYFGFGKFFTKDNWITTANDLINFFKENPLKQEDREKSDDVQSLELLLGMKIIALWIENPDGKSWNNAKLNIRCLQEVNVEKGGYLKEVQGRADVEMTMVWEFKELRDLKALDFVPEGKGHCGKNE